MLERLFALETSGIKLGLENIERLCDALGHPERSFVSLHVAGTNGKGSVSAMVHAALHAAGLRAARYTSPHLVELNERFVIGAEPAETAVLEDAVNHVLDTAERLRSAGVMTVEPTFFEATTAVAFELFRRAGVDVAVIEVGLGGRFDATNVVPAPIGAITSIGIDHAEHLGSTVEAIAFEKAGIIKHGMTVITGVLPPAADAVVARVAAERGARIVRAAARAPVDASFAGGRTVATFDTPVDRYGPLTLALRGTHQVGNAQVAVCMLEAAQDSGLLVRSEAVERGLSAVVWPARLESIDVGHRCVLLDAAHNVEGARALAAYLSRWHPGRPPLVVGMMRDKDARGILEKLLPVTSTVVATEAGIARALPAEAVARTVREVDSTRAVHVERDVAAAIERAWQEGDLVCVAGSVILAGTARDALKRRAMLRNIPQDIA